MILQLLGKIAVCSVVFTYQKSTCGILVNAVDDSWPHNTVNAGQVPLAMVHNGIYQSSAGMSVGGMNNHSLWLIYYQYVLILIQNVQRDIFRKNIRLGQIRQGCLYQIPCLYFIVCFYDYSQ